MDLKELIDLSDKALASNNLKEANNFLEKAIKINPNIFQLYHKDPFFDDLGILCKLNNY